MTYSGPGIFDRNFVLLFNLGLIQSLIPTTSYVFSWNTVSWSISTEYFFYLAFPLLLINIEKTWIWKVGIFAVIGAISFPVLTSVGVPAISDDPRSVAIYPFLYANPLSRGLQFCAGMASGAWDRYLRRKSLSFAAWTTIEIATIIALGIWLRAYPAGIACIPVELAMWANISACTIPFAVFIAAIASGRGLLGGLLTLPAVVWLAKSVTPSTCYTGF